MFDFSFSVCVAGESSGPESFRALWQMLCALKAIMCLFAVMVQTYQSVSQDSDWIYKVLYWEILELLTKWVV